jgi:hypothetical protein
MYKSIFLAVLIVCMIVRNGTPPETIASIVDIVTRGAAVWPFTWPVRNADVASANTKIARFMIVSNSGFISNSDHSPIRRAVQAI